MVMMLEPTCLEHCLTVMKKTLAMLNIANGIFAADTEAKKIIKYFEK